MPTHRIRITQVSRIERSIVVEVEAPTADDAVELQDDSAAPDASDPRWTTVRSEIMNEDVGPA